MTENVSPAAQRIQQLLHERGIDTKVVEFPQSMKRLKACRWNRS
jgi:hypothetical protein